jgi:heme/copper-type cytochrome/quinol oxidase subunit 2
MGFEQGPDVPPAPMPPAPQAPAPGGYQAPDGTYTAPQKTNGFAIASLVFGIIGGVLLALVFGYIALSQIRRSGGRQGGRGLALAGVTLGWVWLGIVIILVAVNAGSSTTTG